MVDDNILNIITTNASYIIKELTSGQGNVSFGNLSNPTTVINPQTKESLQLLSFVVHVFNGEFTCVEWLKNSLISLNTINDKIHTNPNCIYNIQNEIILCNEKIGRIAKKTLNDINDLNVNTQYLPQRCFYVNPTTGEYCTINFDGSYNKFRPIPKQLLINLPENVETLNSYKY